MANTFAISIGGRDLSPSTLRLRDLYEVLHAFEVAAAVTAGQGAQPAEADFHLIGIKEGNSADCMVAVNHWTYGGAVRCARAVLDRNLSELPEKARDSLLSIRARARAKGWRVIFSDADASPEGMPTAEIDPDTEFVTDAILTGPASLAGRLVRVGGTPRPTANLMLLDGRRLTASVASEELATRLGARLYDIIGIEGEAKWTSADWSLTDFKITGISDYQASESLLAVMDDLSSIAGGFWDEIDPDEYIASLRAESD